MNDGKRIAKLLCGSCPANSRTVVAVLVDTANGAALHARLRRPSHDARIIAKPMAVVDQYDGVLLRDMPSPSVRSGWFEGEAPPVASIGCRRHGWGVGRFPSG